VASTPLLRKLWPRKRYQLSSSVVFSSKLSKPLLSRLRLQLMVQELAQEPGQAAPPLRQTLRLYSCLRVHANKLSAVSSPTGFVFRD
jgi:hypothetical protein